MAEFGLMGMRSLDLRQENEEKLGMHVGGRSELCWAAGFSALVCKFFMVPV